MCLKTKSRYSLLDRSFFAKIYQPVLKLFMPNFASLGYLTVIVTISTCAVLLRKLSTNTWNKVNGSHEFLENKGLKIMSCNVHNSLKFGKRSREDQLGMKMHKSLQSEKYT